MLLCNNLTLYISYRLKNVLVLEDEEKKSKMIESHNKIGKSFKIDVQEREKEIESLE